MSMKKTISAVIACLSVIAVHAQTALTIGWPAEGYHSPSSLYLVPLDTVVHFNAFSAPGVRDWRWDLPGASPTVVESQEASVVYADEGIYGVNLEAMTDDGKEELRLERAVQAGGANFVWNISGEETGWMDVISLAWYGYYGGTNWLGMEKFAESFHRPVRPAYIDSVAVWFGHFQSVKPDTMLVVSVAEADDEGMPGETLASASVPASQLVKSAELPTCFCFAQPALVDGPFFIVVEGFPNRYGDDVAMLCLRRDEGALCTAYHLLADEDANYRPTGTYTWYQNVDDPTSFAVSPWLRYSDTSGISGLSSEDGLASYDGSALHIPVGTVSLEIYTSGGSMVFSQKQPATTLPLDFLPRGTYLVRTDSRVAKIIK